MAQANYVPIALCVVITGTNAKRSTNSIRAAFNELGDFLLKVPGGFHQVGASVSSSCSARPAPSRKPPSV